MSGSTRDARYAHRTGSISARKSFVTYQERFLLLTSVYRLSIIDDNPRREFSPRQRHTLKEFAVSDFPYSATRSADVFQQIAMRELELWRDKAWRHLIPVMGCS